MSKLRCRGSIALAVVVVALLCPGVAEAQVVFAPGSPPGYGASADGTLPPPPFEVMDQAKAERQLRHTQEKLRRHSERGNAAAAGHDRRRIDRLRFRIVVDEWLIRKKQDFSMDGTDYPLPLPFRMHPLTIEALSDVRRPAPY